MKIEFTGAKRATVGMATSGKKIIIIPFPLPPLPIGGNSKLFDPKVLEEFAKQLWGGVKKTGEDALEYILNQPGAILVYLTYLQSEKIIDSIADGFKELQAYYNSLLEEYPMLKNINDPYISMEEYYKYLEAYQASDALPDANVLARDYADSVRNLSKNERPSTVAVIVTVDGNIVYGYSGEGVINTGVQDTLDTLGNSNYFNRQCAEVNAISKALNNGHNLTGATIAVVHVRGANSTGGLHGTANPPCIVCLPLITHYRMTYISI